MQCHAHFAAHRIVDAVSGCAALGTMAAMVKFAGEFRPESQTVRDCINGAVAL